MGVTRRVVFILLLISAVQKSFAFGQVLETSSAAIEEAEIFFDELDAGVATIRDRFDFLEEAREMSGLVKKRRRKRRYTAIAGRLANSRGRLAS